MSEYDSWDFEPAPATSSDQVDTWDSWDTPGPGSLDLAPPSFDSGPSGYDGGFDGGGFGGKGNFGGPPMNDWGGFKGDFGKGPPDFGKGKDDFGKGWDGGKGGFDMGKGGFDGGKGGFDGGKGPMDFGKGPPDFMKGGPDFGKGPPDFGNFGKGDDFGKGDFGKGPMDFGKGGGMDFGKGGFDDFGGKGMDFKGGKGDFYDGSGPPPFMGNKGFDGKGMGMPPPGASAKAQGGGFVSAPQIPLKGDMGMKGMPPNFQNFDGGKGPGPMGPPPGMKGGPMFQPGPPPPPGGPPPPPFAPIMNGSFAKAAPVSGGLAPELLALTEAENIAPPPIQIDDGSMLKAIPSAEKKPRLLLLLTRLAPDLQSEHMQQLLEQCGEVQGWRRARDPSGKPMSFGFAQFADPEAAWKASTCISKLVLCGMEVKVLLEEQTENIIQQWRAAQQAALKVATTEELEWELERKSVDCKTAIDAKIEEIYGADKSKGGKAATGKRRQELRQKEQARILRVKKRKAWREAEFAKELEKVESLEKRLRREEKVKDGLDRTKEQQDAPKAKDESDLKAAKKEELGEIGGPLESVRALAVIGNDNRTLNDLVDRIQSESRDNIFKMNLDVTHLRNEKTLEKKLRPWLDQKINLYMGGQQCDIVEYVLRRVNAGTSALALSSDLQRYLDDNADALVERMWRMLIFELMRDGRSPIAKSER